jgi:putative addiction module antidote
VTKQGNSLGVVIPKEFLAQLGLAKGDEVTMRVSGQHIELSRADDNYNHAMDLGRATAARYRHALAKLAK